ncbi:ABC transporter ATP-binding protein [Streptomyces radicis]|uniref:ABC-type quaternary amine transporter n=1 Tax=Streptomyces radicis TaxID=1750517 RepID=A0A3A9WJ74_9ACTN|nr:ABC transporter ATP-binding protein [Streptomyces radicis]RKN12829.1 ABC transporter ATP-binding protein [Streptomyces radicis]RKN27406.1 ABC transporter ATP-binding protein [Streptomyces radicis]
MTELRVRGLTKTYRRGEPVLRGLDLNVAGGELTAVLGPSGCGKTTLLRIIAGFVEPTGGTVAVGGRVLSGPGVRIRPERRAIGIVAQEGALFPHLSVARNITFGLTALARPDRRARAGELLELVGLAGLDARMPHELSGGQQQRVALARALAPRPSVVLFDEPFNALDSSLRGGLRDDVRAALRATGATAVLVTHDQQEALSVADRVAVLREGRVEQHGTPEEVYRQPASMWVAGFVGDAVLVPASAAGGIAHTPLGRVPLTTDARTTDADGDGTALLRPEQLRLGAADASATRGTVTDIRFHGHDTVALISVGGLPRAVAVRHAGPLALRPGDSTGLTITGTATFYPDAPPPSSDAATAEARAQRVR